MPGVEGFIYPNELELQWSVLIVLYPYITGLVAGAFILASLERVFKVEAVKPTYRLALLTALAFLIVAPLPLQLHLGHPERSLEMYLTPHTSSAMAMFGFVYLWYLMAVLVLEIWLDYRKDIVLIWKDSRGWKRTLYAVMALGSDDISQQALETDDKVGQIITIIGIPSAFLLHGYVGFIFGSIKANPWWSSVLMPIVFLFSAIVSGIALVILLYMIIYPLLGGEIDMKCVDKGMSFLFYAVIVDFSLEFVDFLHRIYQSEEEIKILGQLVMHKIFFSLVIVQVLMGMLFPLGMLAAIKIFKRFRETDELRRLLYFVSLILIQGGVFATRWNVVIGGQMFSKSFRGLTTYKMEFGGLEGLLYTLGLLALPLIILTVFLKVLPAWKEFAKSPRGTEA